MRTFDISLPITKPVVFPPLCVVCERENPNGLIKLSFLGIKTTPVLEMAVDRVVYDAVDPKYYGANTNNIIEGIPACASCASGLKWYHRILKFGYYTAWIPGLILILLGVPTIISVPFLILCAVAPGVLSLIFPPSFGASFWDDKANFEFKSNMVATEFLELNSEASLKIPVNTNSSSALSNEAEK